MVDIQLRGELWDNDSADVLRWWGFRDITAPMDIQAALDAAAGDLSRRNAGILCMIFAGRSPECLWRWNGILSCGCVWRVFAAR